MILAPSVIYAIWAWRSQDSHSNTWITNTANWQRNRSATSASSYILLFEHGRRLNSGVSNQANNRKFGRMLRWFLSVSMSYAIWEWRSRDSHINARIPKIVNWKWNRLAKTASSYIAFFEHGRRLNSAVSNHAKQYKNLQNCRICNTLQVMQRKI